MINKNFTVEYDRDELMRAIQLYFNKIVQTRIIHKGGKRGVAVYLSIPVDIARKYKIPEKRFRVKFDQNYVIYIEDPDGEYIVKNYGNKRGPAYYLLFPIKELPHKTRVLLFIEQEKPLIFRVITPA